MVGKTAGARLGRIVLLAYFSLQCVFRDARIEPTYSELKNWHVGSQKSGEKIEQEKCIAHLFCAYTYRRPVALDDVFYRD